MKYEYIRLDDKPDKKFVSFFLVIFGFLCLLTSGWWALFLVRVPENENVFWLGTIFLLLFGLYQIYAGLGFAKRYLIIEETDIIIRHNSLLPAKRLTKDSISKMEIRSMDIKFYINSGNIFKFRLGLKYPDLGESVKARIITWSEENNIDLFYKYDKI
ncbi:MAG: hypothetical protein K8R35_05450 [Bacteroidales bacterium]|nr:hypothetical protein [Bacteroidales bacterium]